MSITTDDLTHCFVVGTRIIDFQHPVTLKSLTFGETVEQLNVRYPGVTLSTYEDYVAAKSAEQDAPITWTPSTAKQHHYMIEVLPPAFLSGGLVLVGEPMDHHARTGRPRFDANLKLRGEYWASSRPMTRTEARQTLIKIASGSILFDLIKEPTDGEAR